jgi:hypothetical protein
MSAPHHDDDELVRYLLGLLPDETRERLDEASIVDDELAARLHAVETNLVDRYVRGQLSGATRDRFESYYLSSPRRRENVRLAADFLAAIDRAVRPARRNAFPRLAAAAALAIAVGGAFLFQRERPRSEIAKVTSGSEAVVRGPSGTPSVSPSAAAPSPDGKHAALPARIVAVVLPPPTRSVAPAPTVTMPAGVDRVRFELQLEAHDFASYRVGLQDPATRQTLWRSDWIVPRASANQVSVPVLVPARLLTPRHHSLELTGRDAGGRVEVIGIYAVRVVQP